MIPNSYYIKSYPDLPILNETQIQQIINEGQQLVAYDELIVTLNGFNHPGNSHILQPYINNFNLNIKEQFQKYLHSDYAELTLSIRTIGRLASETNLNDPHQIPIFEGNQLFTRVQRSPLFRLHQHTIQKIDFSKPIWSQIDSLNLQEKQSLIHVPTFIQTDQKVVFKEDPFEDFWYTSNFWRSSLTFQAAILATIVYLFVQQEVNLSLIHSLPFFVFGFLKWTAIEYYFHRFLLHYSFSKNSEVRDHLMHHIFPQIRGKIAVSIYKVGYYMVGFYFFYSMLLEKFDIIVLLLGVLTGLTFYDIAHYYFHFGPEINIGWINDLKRNHLKHHYRNPDERFGVSNTLWDSLFKTLHGQKPEKYNN